MQRGQHFGPDHHAYLTSAPPHSLASLTWKETLGLDGSKAGWLSSLRATLVRTTESIVSLPQVIGRDTASDTLRRLEIYVDESLRRKLLSNKVEVLMLRELWHEGTSRKGVAFQTYLFARVHNHRVALTRILCGGHGLATELALCSKRGIPPRSERRCRACGLDIEDVIHAMLLCQKDPQLTSARQAILEGFSTTHPAPLLPTSGAKDAWTSLLVSALEQRELVDDLARLAWHTLLSFKAVQADDDALEDECDT